VTFCPSRWIRIIIAVVCGVLALATSVRGRLNTDGSLDTSFKQVCVDVA
jgi:hypothetical protein